MPRLRSYVQEEPMDFLAFSGLHGYNSDLQLTLTLEHAPNLPSIG